MDVIIILGSPNDEKGNLSNIALSRCNHAIEVHSFYPDASILCTGGFGEHFNTTKKAHGFYTSNYLKSKGIPESRFLDIALSSYTFEDATLSRPILYSVNAKNIILITSDFHMERAFLLFSHIMPDINFKKSPSKTFLPENELT